ncbi:isochorismatase family protein [Pelagibius sp.]|uniref:isochorismatase family protein n=1 Tax=Pelagibius sp. TaxID=1931238 RepID=UPI003B50C0C0
MSHDIRQRSALQSPDRIGIVIVDHLSKHYQTVPDSQQTQAIGALLALRDALDLPATITRYREKGVKDSRDPIASGGSTIVVTNRQVLDPWEDQGFVNVIASWDRATLLVFGRCTEASLTFTVLGALAHGHDCFFVVDAIVWPSSSIESAHRSRIQQAGGVPVSTRQIILELLRDWNDLETRARANQIISKFGI